MLADAIEILRRGYVVALTDGACPNHTEPSLGSYLENPRRFWTGWLYSHHLPSCPSEIDLDLTRLQELGLLREIITTSTDNRHHLSGSKDVIEINGNVERCVCNGCNRVLARADAKRTNPQSPNCRTCGGLLIPSHLRGENPRMIELALKAVSNCRSLLVVDVASPHVYPYSLFCLTAKRTGSHLIGLGSVSDRLIDLEIRAKSSKQALRTILSKL